jgi:hypothetical protein
LIQAEDIDLLLHALIIGVIKDGNTIKGVKAATKSGILDLMGNVIIDATGDGDIASMMGCDFVFGRETDHIAQPMTMIFSVGNVDISELKIFIRKNPADFVQKNHYNGEYLALSGFFSKIEEARKVNDFSLPRDRVLLFQEVRPNQVLINMTRVLNHSGIDALSLSKAEVIGRKQIKEVFSFLQKYIPGFKNSFILRTPSKIGVRETRHIIGEYVMDSSDIIEEHTFCDSISVSAYPIDIHSPEYATLDVDKKSFHKCYEIPLRVMIPKDIEQLVVTGRAVSATHEANASMRVTPCVMGLGEAAGVLAALGSKTLISPRNIDYHLVQETLVKQGQVIHRKDIFKPKE